jgi:hypothetical protein
MDKYSWNAWDDEPTVPDALARADLLSGDPALDRRLAALADADPLGLRVRRQDFPLERVAALRDHASPQHQAYRLPAQAGGAPAWKVDSDA